ncbi:MAG: HAMP domain-containing protein [Chitinophagaceae bacterium]|nr:HAMP domain-containing protein [Chitinophagaceae bacterium]
MLIGLWLSRSISHPVQALRKAAKRVGEGDLTSIVENNSKMRSANWLLHLIAW